jgi:hypothetical protein
VGLGPLRARFAFGTAIGFEDVREIVAQTQVVTRRKCLGAQTECHGTPFAPIHARNWLCLAQ